MEEASARNHSLFNDLSMLHSKVEAAIEEYNRQLAVTDEEMQQQALESVQATRFKALEESREKIRRLS